MDNQILLPSVDIKNKIYLLRKYSVMLDKDLALLYKVETKYLVRAVKRNIDRFPEDFAFQLTNQELTDLRCQNGTSSGEKHGGTRYLPWVFTEHGILMLSSVLKNKRAALVNVQIMRSFVQIRKMLHSHEYLLDRLKKLEDKYDHNFKEVFQVLRNLLQISDNKEKNPIGFRK